MSYTIDCICYMVESNTTSTIKYIAVEFGKNHQEYTLVRHWGSPLFPNDGFSSFVYDIQMDTDSTWSVCEHYMYSIVLIYNSQYHAIDLYVTTDGEAIAYDDSHIKYIWNTLIRKQFRPLKES
jgi:hypothetical protein